MVNPTQLFAPGQAVEALSVEDFIQQYQPVIYRLAVSVLGDPAQAEGAAQEALRLALDGRESYRGEASLKTWIYSITLNVCRLKLQKGQTPQRLQQTLVRLLRFESYIPTPEEAVTRQDERDLVWGAIMKLDDSFRLPILLRYYDNLPIAEIAQALGTSQRTVYVRLHKAHERLKRMLRSKVEWVWPI